MCAAEAWRDPLYATSHLLTPGAGGADSGEHKEEKQQGGEGGPASVENKGDQGDEVGQKMEQKGQQAAGQARWEEEADAEMERYYTKDACSRFQVCAWDSLGKTWCTHTMITPL